MADESTYGAEMPAEITISGFFEAIDRLAGLKAEALLPSGRGDPILAQRIREVELYRDANLARVAPHRPNFHILDKKQDPDEPILVTLTYNNGIEFYEGLSLSLNRGGLFIKTESLLSIDSILDMTVKIQDVAIQFHVTAKVIWINPRESAGRPIGMGVKFPKLSNDQRALIEEFMQGSAPTVTLVGLHE
jgi:uncharacterized protein (TIGR02266 family)